MTVSSPSAELTDESALRRQARAAGVLYLAIIVCAGFAEGYVRAGLVVRGDANATAANILGSQQLYRLGFGADLVAFLCDVALALLLYLVLKHAGGTLSLIAAGFRMAQAAILGVNLLNHLAALLLLTGSVYVGAFDAAQLNALALFFLDAHKYGYLISGAFFGVHCLLLGYLLIRSRYFPSALGLLMLIAGLAYLLNSFTSFVLPRFEDFVAAAIVAPAVVAELSLCIWLLTAGVRQKRISS